MKSNDKDCRYELHHPMSLSDALAALFRGKSKPRRAENVEGLFGLRRPAGLAEPEPAPAKSKERDEAIAQQMQGG